MKHDLAGEATSPPICDYEGSPYQSAFWGDGQRGYEDLAERIALRALLPPTGDRIIEIGAGFGRLANLYQGYDQIILLDYSKSLLREAQAHLGHDPRYIYVVGNVYNLPIASHAVQTLVMVRVMHHLQDAPRALQELVRITASQGYLVLEYASKHHLKSIVRYFSHRQSWNPFALEPYEFAPLNFNFHPRWMTTHLQRAGLHIEAERGVSWFRLPFLKQRLSATSLARLDGWLQPLGSKVRLTPSIFLRARAPFQPVPAVADLFRCPHCHHESPEPTPAYLHCARCGAHWPIENGIYDFKTA